jgi:hypothetical protein
MKIRPEDVDRALAEDESVISFLSLFDLIKAQLKFILHKVQWLVFVGKLRNLDW